MFGSINIRCMCPVCVRQSRAAFTVRRVESPPRTSDKRSCALGGHDAACAGVAGKDREIIVNTESINREASILGRAAICRQPKTHMSLVFIRSCNVVERVIDRWTS